MNREWSLDALYQGYEDPKFKEDLAALEGDVERFGAALRTQGTPEQVLTECLRALEALELRGQKLGAYISLRQSTNTADPETAALMERVSRILSESAASTAAMTKFVAGIENLEELIEKNDFLREYAFLLKEEKEQARYTLSDEVEAVISKLNLSGGSAWGTQQEYLTSTVEVAYRDQVLNLPAVRNLAYEADPQVRKDAYEAELAAYPKIRDGVCFSLNNLKMQVNTLCDLRGYESPLDLTLRQSRMRRATLDAMWEAIRESLPDFHRYLRRKGELLGHPDGLPWYDLFAPMGEDDGRKYTVEEARDYLIEHFRPFAPDLAEMMEEAFRDAWIDFYPHNGKVGGAFCANLPFIGQSRVLTNFDGAFGDIVTLAHELGHAYHGLQIQDHRPLNTDYSMPVAETASTFNETVIMNGAIAEASGARRLRLLESQLQDTTQIICDIYSRFLFESAVFERRREEFLFPDTLCEMMLDAQKQAYGDGLDQKILHPYMWVNKSHYYSESLSFYNFPYAFGGLFARGLYARYLQEGEAFLPKYRALLKATTVSSVEDVARYADIDLTDPSFWRDSLKVIRSNIDEFMEMTK